MDTVLLVDYSNTLIRSISVNKHLWGPNGEFTGGVYGVFTQLMLSFRTFKPTHVLICADSKPYLREKEFPGYKGDRKKYADDDFDFYKCLKQSTELLDELFGLLGIPTWSIAGLEADDLIASAVQSLEYTTCVLKSNDTDLNQLLSYSGVVINKKSKFATRLDAYGPDEFKTEFPKISPSDWVEYTAMVGTHNGVPGIKGIGPATAAKYLNNEELYEEFKSYHIQALNKKWDLIKLPFPLYGKSIRIPTPKRPSSNYRQLLGFLDTLGITFTNKMRETLEDFN